MTQADEWLSRWHTGRIGFHQASVAPVLAAHWRLLGLPPGVAVLVPLCGKSLDVQWLHAQEHSVIGVEISSVALECLLQEGGIGARRRVLPTHEEFCAERLRLLCGDFFGISEMGVEGIPAVYDRAAFAAMAPQYRESYVASIRAASARSASILLTVLEYPESETDGPPFSIPLDEIKACYGGSFSIHELDRVDILEKDARMRARGLTRLHEISYLLKRFR